MWLCDMMVYIHIIQRTALREIQDLLAVRTSLREELKYVWRRNGAQFVTDGGIHLTPK